ncbi:MAG: hypothetical protein J7K40_01255 [candidate division Zixibacteria bacterium]|nr:hypothetical protein [candidate division Zixibacteria bacterium]
MQDSWIQVATVIKKGPVITISDADEDISEVLDCKPINPQNEWASVLALADFSDGMYEIYGKIEGIDDKIIKEIWIRSYVFQDLNSLSHAI